MKIPLGTNVDRAGVIQCSCYGRDEGDHLPIAEVKAFAAAVKPAGSLPARLAGALS